MSLTIEQALQSYKSTPLTALEAQLLMLHALGKSSQERAWLLTHAQEHLSPETFHLFQTYAQKRMDHVPLSYLTGEKEFYGLALSVDSRVLDPRADTETLVDWALFLIKELQSHTDPKNLQILDLGTGSGAIALAIKAHAPTCNVWAIDKSQEALDVTKLNACKLALEVQCMQSHWFSIYRERTTLSQPKIKPIDPKASLPERFDLIVSNPPYIAPEDPHLHALVHEPMSALMAQEEGLADLREICAQAREHLKPGAWLVLEHGHDQSAQVREMLRQWGYTSIQSRFDLAGIERCTGAQWPKMK